MAFAISPKTMQVSTTIRSGLDDSLNCIHDITKWSLYHCRTLWLFTVNDFKTMIFPSIVFALCTALRDTQAEIRHEHLLQLFSQLPRTMVWLWINLLAFTVSNQKSPRGIEEDRLNKPWRPIPSGRLTMESAETMAQYTYPVALLLSLNLGGLLPCTLLVIFGSLYNDFGWDEHWFLRNLLNAGGFTSFAAGALEVTIRSSPDRVALLWLSVVALVVLTTVHAQDMYDQVGDAAAGRRTIPLIIGDGPARYTIAIGVCCWSIFCCRFWNAGFTCYAVTIILGSAVAIRSLRRRTIEEDRTTFKIYNVWLMGLYLLPALQS